MPMDDDLTYFYRDEVYIETTNGCNIRCRFCENPALKHPRGVMAMDVFRKAVDDIAEHPLVKTVNLVGIGETFLHPRIWEMIDYVHSRGVACHTCTNGKWRATEEQLASITRLDHIHITIDGITNDVYQISRPDTDVERIFDTVRRILNARRQLDSQTPHVQVRMNLFAFNRHQLFDLIRVCREIGVDSVWIARGAAAPSLQTTLSDEEWERLPHGYVLTSGFERSRPTETDQRTGLNGWRYNPGAGSVLNGIGCNGTTIRWDGNLTACCFDFNATAVMGNIRDESLKTIWSRRRVQAFEDDLLGRHRKRVHDGRTIQCDRCPDFLNYIARCQTVAETVQPIERGGPDRIRRAAEHLHAGRLNDSDTLLLGLLREFPMHPEALHLMGISAFRRGELELAEQLLRKAIAASTLQSSKLHDELGLVLGQQRDSAQARLSFQASEQLRSYAAEMHSPL
ncbi:MAG TPA: radical SAM protein [Desulfosarcina sp.]|nr:radical SAM protein [Desulfosarcina sp.]